MFEFHGWATIREASDESGEDELKLREIVEALTQHVSNMGWSTNKAELSYINGSVHLIVSGLTNHRATEASELFELYRNVARLAPGSYGLLYIHDDENVDELAQNEFEVWVLRRGQLLRRKDEFLSPIVPTIEDAPV